MGEPKFREIQLSGKQLVFVFMTSVALAMAVFLLGVSVGRGVRANGNEIEIADQMAAAVPPAELPPPTEVTPTDTTYHDNLLGTTTPPAEPEPVAEPVGDEAADPRGEAPASDPPPAAPSAAPPTRPAQTPAPSPPPAAASPATSSAPATAGWFLQVGAYRSRENAERQARELASKGYAATAVAPESAGGLHRVRIGPFVERAEAVRVQTQLRSEEGTTSSLTR